MYDKYVQYNKYNDVQILFVATILVRPHLTPNVGLQSFYVIDVEI